MKFGKEYLVIKTKKYKRQTANLGLPKVGQNRKFEHLEFY